MGIACIADIELEQFYLNRIIMLSAVCSGMKDEDIVTKEKIVDIKSDLMSSVRYIGMGLTGNKFKNPIRNEYFSIDFYSTIFNYYWKEIMDGRFPSIVNLRKYVCKLDVLQQNSLLLHLNEILNADMSFNPEHLHFRELKLPDLGEMLVKACQERSLKDVFDNGGDIDLLEAMINDLKAKKPESERLQEKLDLLNSPDVSPIEKALIRRDVVSGLRIPSQDLDAIIESVNLPPAPLVIPGDKFILEHAEGGGAWIYPGIIRRGAVTLVVGIPGSMKSMWGLDVIISYFNNKPFMGEYPSVLASRGSGRCLILNGDQTRNELREMLQKNPSFSSVAHRFDIVNDFTVSSMDWLIKQMHKEKYEFVFVDAYVSIHRTDPKFDENKDTAGLTIKAFNKLADDFGSAFIVIHHGKQDSTAHGVRKSRGNQSISGSASTVITLDAPIPDKSGNVRDNLIRWAEVVKIRNEALFKQGIRFNPETYHFDNIADGMNHQRKHENGFAESIFNMHFKTNIEKKWTLSELAHNLIGEFAGDKKAYVTKILTKLEQRSAIERFVNVEDPREVKWRYKKHDTPQANLDGAVF